MVISGNWEIGFGVGSNFADYMIVILSCDSCIMLMDTILCLEDLG